MESSPSMSFRGWDIFVFFKGRKKMLVTLLAGVLAYVISDQATVAAVAGAGVEMVFSLVEYYLKKYE